MPEDFLRNILADLGINHRGANLAEMQARLNEAVLVESEAGRRLVMRRLMKRKTWENRCSSCCACCPILKRHAKS